VVTTNHKPPNTKHQLKADRLAFAGLPADTPYRLLELEPPLDELPLGVDDEPPLWLPPLDELPPIEDDPPWLLPLDDPPPIDEDEPPL
jgi:hypothetical protein